MVRMSNNGPPASQPLEMLAHEQAQASTALNATLRDFWGHLPSAQQLQKWAEANPLYAAGAAAGAGALAGAIVTPSSHRPASARNHQDNVNATAPRATLVSSLLAQVFPMLSVVLAEAGRSLVLSTLAPGEADKTTHDTIPPENTAGDGI